MPGTGLHGRKHARTFDAGLREVLCQDGDSVSEPAVQAIFSFSISIVGTDTTCPARGADVALRCTPSECLNRVLL